MIFFYLSIESVCICLCVPTHSVAQYGELAPECADAFILYGKALLNNAISKSGVLGGTVAKKETAVEAASGSGRRSFQFSPLSPPFATCN
jgi:hypothetical protein